MNIRVVTKGDRIKGNGDIQRKAHCHNVPQKSFVFHNVPQPSPQLSDKSEFPSLNEISGKVHNNSHSSGGILKYSDKLKLHKTSQNQNTVPNFFHFKNEPVVTDAYKELDHNTSGTQIANKWFHNKNKTNFSEKRTFKNESDKTSLENTNKVDVNSSHNTSKAQFNHTLKQSHSSKHNDHKNQKPLANIPNSKLQANFTSQSYKPNNQTLCKTEIKLNLENSSVKEVNDTSGSNITKKKKKRKSKVKRQVSLQTGKITVLTPEVHSKILNQTSAFASQNFRGILTDINDEEEYPELGKPVIPTSQKENYPKKESISADCTYEATDKKVDTSTDKQLVITKDVSKESPPLSISDDKLVIEKKGKSDNKAVHLSDPITVSFFDMILNKSSKTKVKDFKAEVDTSPSTGLVKMKVKKNSCHPHNLLDSSSPAVKRGKEREKPKQKKPSQLKKIILLDRKVRREQFLLSKNNNLEENVTICNEFGQEKISSEDNEEDIISENENNYDNSSSNTSTIQLELSDENTFLLPSDDNLSLQDDLVLKMSFMDVLGINEKLNLENTSNNSSFIATPIDNTEIKNFSEETAINLSLDEKEPAEPKVTTDSALTTEMHSNASKSPDSLLNSLINGVKESVASEKDKAVKILLHTRNFREYCNHLISKDIDDVVFTLLDDLARFQDRLHQKDPVKARMKRRMLYGVKEVKKHIKLRKLKCIIVAADIENIEAHGGLNDLLNDIKSSAADHHIPCVFALSRKVLGKVCRKPVPVSCVGVFNFEGSEINFRKMVELQTQSRTDYVEISNKLSHSLTEVQVAMLIKAKKEAPETLRTIRANILGDFFLEPKNEAIEHDIKSEKTSDSSDTET